MIKILIVDDEEKLRELIVKYAKYEGFDVSVAKDGLEAIDKVNNEDYDLVVLDIMMPNLDGFSACKKIINDKNIPIIMLSAKNEEYDKVHAFELGADDYVVKSLFSPKELMMRIKAVLNRTNAKNKHSIFELDGIRIDYDAHVVYIDDKTIYLSPKEYDLLTYFCENVGIALTREQILNRVWNTEYYGDDRTLDTHIKLLRKSINPYSKYLITLRGVGYRFEKN